MIYFRLVFVSLLLVSATAMTGCRTAATHLSDDFGATSARLFSAQVVNPEAPADRTAARGMPGYTGVQIYNDTYLEQVAKETAAW